MLTVPMYNTSRVYACVCTCVHISVLSFANSLYVAGFMQELRELARRKEAIQARGCVLICHAYRQQGVRGTPL